jgi:hypothetical protein
MTLPLDTVLSKARFTVVQYLMLRVLNVNIVFLAENNVIILFGAKGIVPVVAAVVVR